jgi:nitrate reductase gamma subunit
MSELLHFSEHTLQEIALIFMALVYTIRIIWLLRFKAGGDRQAPTGLPGTTPAKGILYSWANVAMPWAMESTRSQFSLYVQFVIFHLGVTAAILLSFIIPYGPGLLNHTALVLLLQIVIGAAFVVGIIRIIRRVGSPYMRAISSPDDYFSLVLLTVWFLSAVLAAPNDASGGEWHLLSFFILTAFFLIYVPFSKISHYLYYPFTRYYLGKTMGYRGIYPPYRG